MKVMVIGASGLVGSHLLENLSKNHHSVLGTTRNQKPKSHLRTLDLADMKVLLSILEEFRPDVVVNAAGFTWADGCEQDEDRSRRENLEQPLEIAGWCQNNGARYTYCSSSYVFDGTRGCYKETDKPNPINVYGRHKLAAEEGILDLMGPRALVARLICVWGKEDAKKNFAYQVMRAAVSKEPMRLPIDQSGNPTWSGDIAHWLRLLIEKNHSGVWHLAADNPEMTRPIWANHITDGLAAQGLAANPNFICVPTADLGQLARRPLLAGLNTQKIQLAFPHACRAPSDLMGQIL